MGTKASSMEPTGSSFVARKNVCAPASHAHLTPYEQLSNWEFLKWWPSLSFFFFFTQLVVILVFEDAKGANAIAVKTHCLSCSTNCLNTGDVISHGVQLFWCFFPPKNKIWQKKGVGYLSRLGYLSGFYGKKYFIHSCPSAHTWKKQAPACKLIGLNSTRFACNHRKKYMNISVQFWDILLVPKSVISYTTAKSHMLIPKCTLCQTKVEHKFNSETRRGIPDHIISSGGNKHIIISVTAILKRKH